MNKIVTLLFFLTSIYTYSQTILVSGQIKDNNQQELPFANIVFRSTTDEQKVYGTIGDEAGNFSVEVTKDIYNVEISVVSLAPKTIALDLTNSDSKKDMGSIVVNTEVALDEVVVKDNKSSYSINLDKKVYDVSKDVIAKGGTLTDVMQNLPSVQVESDGNVSLRGDNNVRILIDGKPSGLASSSDLFSTIPSSSIESVEVITNPSSKYAAQGTGGIINVVLKKGQKKRFNSSIELFGGYRFNSGFNGNITKNGETGSWYINAGVGYSEPKGVNNVFSQTPNDLPTTSSQESDRIRNQYYYLVNIGGNKTIGEKNDISGSLTYRGAQSDNENNTFGQDFDNELLFAAFRRDEQEEENNNFVQGNLNYDIKLSENGHKFSLSLSGELTKDDESAMITAAETFPDEVETSKDNTSNEEERTRYVISADYTIPFKNKSMLELGYRSDFSSIENSFAVDRTIDGQVLNIPEFTDSTKYNEKVHAFYGQYAMTFNKLSIRLGLRTEISDIDITLGNTISENKKDFIDLFPSSFFTYDFNDANKVQLSVSRRVNRPGSWMIVPFSTFTDDRNIFVGNPNINPSYVFASELGYTAKFSNKFSLFPTLFYRKTSNEMEFFVEKQQLTIGNESQEIFASTITNVGDYYSYGSEIGFSYKPFNWWDIYSEITFNGFKQRGSVRGVDFNGDGVLVSGRFNTKFSLFTSMKLQIQNYYRGPIETGQYSRKGFYGMNVGLSNNIFKNNGTIAVNVRDAFNSNKRIVTTTGEDFERDLELQFRVRQINVSLTYRFNQKKHNGKKGSQYDNFEIVN